MISKELKRLSRKELLELLIEQRDMLAQTQAELEAAKAELDKRHIVLDKVGTMAEATFVRDTTFSYKEPGFATVYVQSSGAEPPRSIQLRKKESTGEWFLWDQKLLDPIQKPQKHDPYK